MHHSTVRALALFLLVSPACSRDREAPIEFVQGALATSVAWEAEVLARTASTTGSQITSEAGASGGKYVQLSGTPAQGAWVQFTTANVAAGTYTVTYLFKSNYNRAIVQTTIDGVTQGSCNQYASSPTFQVSCSLGMKNLAAGNHTIRFTASSKSTSSSGYMIVVDRISLGATSSGGTGGAGGTGGRGGSGTGAVGTGGTGTGGTGTGGSGAGGGSGSGGADGGAATDGGGGTVPANDWFGNWPAGSAPTEVAPRVAANYLARGLTKPMYYAEACTWYGGLTYAKVAADSTLDGQLITRFNPILSDSSYIGTRAQVDDRVAGIVPLEIYLHTADTRYLTIGKNLADAQWSVTTSDGITAEARYWVDDMYMITALQVQAYRATNDAKYLDRAALTMASYLDRLQLPNGLFWHTSTAKVAWGRGNGWFAAGMAELLRSLPTTHSRYPRILDGYKKMMAALLQYQTTSGTMPGAWKQVIDSSDTRNWPESSCTGMFAFAITTGIKLGVLPANTYGPAARAGWLALVSFLDSNANAREVCTGTGAASGSDIDAQLTYYFDRPREVGNLHGQAPVLWTASALLR